MTAICSSTVHGAPGVPEQVISAEFHYKYHVKEGHFLKKELVYKKDIDIIILYYVIYGE